MNSSFIQQLDVQSAQLSVSWKCGDLLPHAGGIGTAPRQQVVDWSRRHLDASVALDQVRLIVQTAIHASTGIRSMLEFAHALAHELRKEQQPGSIARIAGELDAVLNQVDGMVMEASLGDINLLGRRKESWKLPYLLTEIQSAGHYHNLITTGMSIAAVRESPKGNAEQLAGIYALSTDESDSVCWIHSPAFWLQLQDEGCVSGLGEEIKRFLAQVKHFQGKLLALESQLSLYMEQVGEVITDL